jgi:AAA family ATP:ADP antiporter
MEPAPAAGVGGKSLIQRIVEIRDGEKKALLGSCLFFFFVLCAYYIVRPVREEMGVAGGVWNIPWLFTGTLIAMMVVHPPFAAMVARLPRTRAVTWTYGFFSLNLVLFALVLAVVPESANIWVGRVFFIWTAVFSLFIVSVFWSVMTDLFTTGQGKRLFGFIGVGGTLGGLVGSGITALLATTIGSVSLLLLSAVVLQGGVFAMRRLMRLMRLMHESRGALPTEFGVEDARAAAPEEGSSAGSETEEEKPLGGSILAGITNLVRSPYLLGICAYMLLFPIISTILYMQQAAIVDAHFVDRALRTAFFARIDVAVNALTLLAQIFLTGRIIKLLGVGLTLAILPIFCMAGFTALGVWQTLGVFVVFQTLRRATNYAVARPARETLYTVVPREDRYKAKNFMDTTVYRAADAIGGWSQSALRALGLTMSAIAFTAVPVALLWLGVALWLGRAQTQRLG